MKNIFTRIDTFVASKSQVADPISSQFPSIGSRRPVLRKVDVWSLVGNKIEVYFLHHLMEEG